MKKNMKKKKKKKKRKHTNTHTDIEITMIKENHFYSLMAPKKKLGFENMLKMGLDGIGKFADNFWVKYIYIYIFEAKRI